MRPHSIRQPSQPPQRVGNSIKKPTKKTRKSYETVVKKFSATFAVK
jgi:hypothetical protein